MQFGSWQTFAQRETRRGGAKGTVQERRGVILHTNERLFRSLFLLLFVRASTFLNQATPQESEQNCDPVRLANKPHHAQHSPSCCICSHEAKSGPSSSSLRTALCRAALSSSSCSVLLFLSSSCLALLVLCLCLCGHSASLLGSVSQLGAALR